MSKSNLTLSIQLIDDSGKPLIDEIFSGGAQEVRSSIQKLLSSKEKWRLTDADLDAIIAESASGTAGANVDAIVNTMNIPEGEMCQLPIGSQIHQAFYNDINGPRGADVTATVRKLYAKEGNFCVNNENMQGDPLFGRRKVLMVSYSVGAHRGGQMMQGQGRATPQRPPKPAKKGGGSGRTPIFNSESGLGGEDVFVKSGANAGLAGGERTDSQVYTSEGVAFDNALSANRGSTVPRGGGTRSTPSLDIITENERNSQILSDGGGSRVNRSADSRNYELGNYERSVIVDNSRHNFDRAAAIAEAEAAGNAESRFQDPSGVGVPYEVAGVGSRIKNLHRVGGQRVPEMDHFVAAVATPKIEVLLKGDDGNLVVAPTANDIGTHVALSTRDTNLNRSFSIQVDCGQAGMFPVLIDSSYVKADPTLVKTIVDIAQVFVGLLATCMGDILRLPCAPKNLQLYYMTTMRSDELCCCTSPKQGHKLYVNVQYFQQQLYCTDSAPFYLLPDKCSEALQVWCTRIQMAVREGNPPWASESAKKGLYDRGNRERFHQAVKIFS